MNYQSYRDKLIREVNLDGKFYVYKDMQPSAYFWKELLYSTEGPKIFLPDTLILNDRDAPFTWVYTGPDGRLAKAIVSLKDFIAKITNYASPN